MTRLRLLLPFTLIALFVIALATSTTHAASGSYGFSVAGYSDNYTPPSYSGGTCATASGYGPSLCYSQMIFDPESQEPYGYSYLTSTAPVATFTVSGSSFASTYPPNSNEFQASGPSSGSEAFSSLFDGQFFTSVLYSATGYEFNYTPLDILDGFTASNGNTVCDAAAQNAGLSKSTRYWCVVEVDSTNAPSQTVKVGIYTSAPTTYTYNTDYGYNSTGYPTANLTTSPSTPASGLYGCYSSFPTAAQTPVNYWTTGTGSAQTTSATNCFLGESTPSSAPTATLTANPTSITKGNSSTLTWTSTNATSCSINNSVGTVTPASGGSKIVSPTTTTTYTITCTGTGGTAADSAAVTVTVPPVSATCSVSPTTASTGQSVTWTATPSGGTGSYTYAWSSTGGSPSTSSSASYATSYASAGTYSANVVVSSGGNSSATIVCNNSVTVVPPAPTVSLTANPTSIVSGNSSTLTWSSSNATSCSAGFTSSTATSGTKVVTPTSSLTYTITCTGAGGSTTATATVTVLSGSCSVSPTSTATGQSVTWTATPSGGTGSYTYSWTASGGTPSSGTASTLSTSYASSGTYSASVTISSGGSSTTVICGNSVTITPPAPAAPTGLTASCNASGTSFNFSWTPVSGATVYYPRVSSSTSAQCTSYGWQLGGTNGVTCYPDPDTDTQTSFTDFPITAGTSYKYWTEAANSGGKSTVVSGTISCVAPAPNLTSTSAPVQTTATVGTAQSFTGGVIDNIGNATATDFPNNFEILNSAGNTLINSVAASPATMTLAANATAPATASYTFSSNGTYEVRFCANMTSGTSPTNVISESDYGDNCGPATLVTVTAAGTPTVSCEVNGGNTQITVPPNQAVTYTAVPSGGATSPYTWIASDGKTGLGTAATASRSFTTDGTYGMQVNATGASAPGLCQTVVVGTTTTCSAAATSTISADPNRLPAGDTSTLTYSASGITPGTSCTITGPSGLLETSNAADSSCNVSWPSPAETTPPISEQSTFTIACTGTTANTTINMIPFFTEF